MTDIEKKIAECVKARKLYLDRCVELTFCFDPDVLKFLADGKREDGVRRRQMQPLED